MSCVLRIDGKTLDLDDCLSKVLLTPDRVYRKGEPKRRDSKDKSLNKSSGFTLLVSEDYHVTEQIKDAIFFLKKHLRMLKELTSRSDVKSPCLDFAWLFPVGEGCPVPAQFRQFPPDLLRICGDLNVAIEVSVYATEDE